MKSNGMSDEKVGRAAHPTNYCALQFFWRNACKRVKVLEGNVGRGRSSLMFWPFVPTLPPLIIDEILLCPPNLFKAILNLFKNY